MLKTFIYATILLALPIVGFFVFQEPILKAFVDSQAAKRPELLLNASPEDSATAAEFHRAFPDPSREAKLIEWLKANQFTIHNGTNTAKAERHLVNSKCGEDLKIYWNRESNGDATNLRAYAGASPCF